MFLWFFFFFWNSAPHNDLVVLSSDRFAFSKDIELSYDLNAYVPPKLSL